MAFVASAPRALNAGAARATAQRRAVAVHMSVSRRDVLRFAAMASLASLVPAATPQAEAAELAAEPKVSGSYPDDAKNLMKNMKEACELQRGSPGMSDLVGTIRKEMSDFVARYRRNDKVSGSPSFSTLYTAINTLSGHYASYGNNYPVPEKRKKRLYQQLNEVDKALARGR